MPPEPETLRGVLYVIVCGAPPARDANRLVQLAQAEGWEVCVIATPSGRSFIDPAALEAATGHPIRSEYKQPDAADVLPPPDAIVVAPATFNTINKWAAGIAEHPAFQVSVDRLRAAGVQLLYGPDVLELHEPGTGSQRVGLFPWQLTLEALDANQARRPFRRLDSTWLPRAVRALRPRLGRPRRRASAPRRRPSTR